GHEQLNPRERLARRRAVLEHQQNAGQDVHQEEKERHSSEVVDRGVPMDGDRLVTRELEQPAEREPLVQPLGERGARRVARHPRETITCCDPPVPATMWMLRAGSGFGGGPPTT